MIADNYTDLTHRDPINPLRLPPNDKTDNIYSLFLLATVVYVSFPLFVSNYIVAAKSHLLKRRYIGIVLRKSIEKVLGEVVSLHPIFQAVSGCLSRFRVAFRKCKSNRSLARFRLSVYNHL